MTVTAIITFTAQSGQREALGAAMHGVAEQLPGVDGFVGIASYNAVDDPDTIIELVEWDSVAAHGAFREHAKSTGLFDAIAAVTTGPPGAIYIEAR
jgi:heme-degrading monooxygenase HmoA